MLQPFCFAVMACMQFTSYLLALLQESLPTCLLSKLLAACLSSFSYSLQFYLCCCLHFYHCVNVYLPSMCFLCTQPTEQFFKYHGDVKKIP